LQSVGFDVDAHGSIALALALSVPFREQAKLGELAGDPLAHERAACEWGYSVGDPKAVHMLRFFSEGLQLGVFSSENLEPFLGKFASHLDRVQALMGDFGTGYDIDFDYLEDAFSDVEIAKEGAIEGRIGSRSGLHFNTNWERRNRCE
jgi:hypothetical protein